MGKDKNQLNQSPDSIDLQVAKLTFIGASIATLGDGLQAIAAGIALEALEKEQSNNKSSQSQNGQTNNKSSQSQNGQSKQLEKMQKQIDDLINELNQVKKMFRW